MEELEILTIDDKDYAVIERITDNNNTYVYVTNVDDETDFFVRKEQNDILLALDNEEELNKALELFAKKHENDTEE